MKNLIQLNQLLELRKHVEMNSLTKLRQHRPLLAQILPLLREQLIRLLIITNELPRLDPLHNINDFIAEVRFGR